MEEKEGMIISVDTNVLVRYVTNDDHTQAQWAAGLLNSSSEIFITKTVLLEFEWVLRAAYKLSRESIMKALLQVLGLPKVIVESEDHVFQAVQNYSHGLDFADALHLASAYSAASFYTFDVDFVRSARKLGLNVQSAATVRNKKK